MHGMKDLITLFKGVFICIHEIKVGLINLKMYLLNTMIIQPEEMNIIYSGLIYRR